MVNEHHIVLEGPKGERIIYVAALPDFEAKGWQKGSRRMRIFDESVVDADTGDMLDDMFDSWHSADKTKNAWVSVGTYTSTKIFRTK